MFFFGLHYYKYQIVDGRFIWTKFIVVREMRKRNWKFHLILAMKIVHIFQCTDSYRTTLKLRSFLLLLLLLFLLPSFYTDEITIQYYDGKYILTLPYCLYMEYTSTHTHMHTHSYTIKGIGLYSLPLFF